MVICLERGADLHMAQQIPLPLTVSYFSKIQIGFTFLVPAHPGSPGQRAIKRVCVCVCVLQHKCQLFPYYAPCVLYLFVCRMPVIVIDLVPLSVFKLHRWSERSIDLYFGNSVHLFWWIVLLCCRLENFTFLFLWLHLARMHCFSGWPSFCVSVHPCALASAFSYRLCIDLVCTGNSDKISHQMIMDMTTSPPKCN